MAPRLWNIRSTNCHTDVDKLYEGLPNIFTLRVQHGGIFSKIPGRRYVFGKLSFVDFVDMEDLSVHELDTILEELGYPRSGRMYYHFCIPGMDLDVGLLPLATEEDINKLSTFVLTNKEIRVYCEHGSSNLTTNLMSPTKIFIEEIEDTPSPALHIGEKKRKESGSCTKKLDFEVSIPNPKQLPLVAHNRGDQETARLPYHKFKSPQNVVNIEEEEIQTDDLSTFNATKDSDPNIIDFLDPISVNGGSDSDGFNSDSEGFDYENNGFTYDKEGGSDNDSDYIMQEDDLVEDYEVDMAEFHCVVDTNVEWVAKEKNKLPLVTTNEEEELEVIDEEKFEFQGYEEDPRERLLKELKKPKYCSHGQEHGSEFYVGQTFETKKELTAVVKEVALKTRKALHIEKNDKIRVRVVCRGVSRESVGNKEMVKCPWVLLVSRPSDVDIWTVKTHEEKHKCLNTRDVKSCTQSFIAKKIAAQLEMNPTCPTRALQEEFQTKHGVNVSKYKIFRAKAIAQHEIHGDYEKQYHVLRDYVLELTTRNPGTTVKIEVESEPNISLTTRQFKRIYICLGALKHGFKESKREILGLDGTFMKGPYEGQILSAVSVDSNNGMFPLAYALVEIENMETWTWFLECLEADLELPPRANFTFISNRQKGLLHAVEKVFPVAEHRFCLRHICENMRRYWKGTKLKEMVWKCATATTIVHFDKQMEELSVFNNAAYVWLKKIPAIHWARSHFTGRSHCQILLNNMCEIFNGQLVDGRDKPIISALEYIREYLMRRMCRVQQVIDKSLGPLTPTATKLLEKIEEEAQQLRVIFAGNAKYQVTGVGNEQYVVDMSERSCSCRSWELTGMPCKHTVAVIWDMKQNSVHDDTVESWFHECYWLSTWNNMYKVKVGPINGRHMWQKSPCQTTLTPPKYKKQVGRPKKNRVRAANETASQLGKMSQGTKLTRKFIRVTCSKCHNKGRNSRGCRGQGGAGESSTAKRSKSKGKGNNVV